MNKIPWWMFTMMTMHVSRLKYKSIKSIQMFSFFQVSLYCDENANTLIKVNQECEVSTATGSSVTTEGSSLPAEGKSSPTLLPSTGWSSWYTTPMAWTTNNQKRKFLIQNIFCFKIEYDLKFPLITPRTLTNFKHSESNIFIHKRVIIISMNFNNNCFSHIFIIINLRQRYFN